MPCSCEGFPPSPTDLVASSMEAVAKINRLEQELITCRKEKRTLEEEISILKKAFSMMGNGS